MNERPAGPGGTHAAAAAVEKLRSSTRPLHPVSAMLATTDLQHGSGVVLDYAAGIAEATGASLHATYVLTRDAVPPAQRALDLDAEEDVLEEARRGLWLQMQSLQRPGADVASVVVARRASTHEGILDVARATGSDLIVMGSHARTRSSSRLGSTADRVVRTSPVPCLIVRGEPKLPLKRAAVLTDFSAASRAGLSVALSWLPALGLDRPDTSLDVLHFAWPQLPSDEPRGPAWMIQRIEKEITEVSTGLPVRPHHVRPWIDFSAYPVEATTELIREREYQMVIVATHGRGALARALLGSVTLGLLHTAGCPLLVVPRSRSAR